jgi:hypothetical protein
VVPALGVGELDPVADPEGALHRLGRLGRRSLPLDDHRLQRHLGEHLGRGRGLVGWLLLLYVHV